MVACQFENILNWFVIFEKNTNKMLFTMYAKFH